VPSPSAGTTHVLAAALDGEELVVRVDGAVAWEGRVGREVLAFDGPVGLRSDNGRFEVLLRAAAEGEGG
jgi:hypothetical protein